MKKIEYYKTYLIAYKFPNDKYANYKRAWPACEDNCTIIPNEYIISYRKL